MPYRNGAPKPPVGVLVKDTDKGKEGEVMGHEGPYVQLRPLGGGREWDADPGALEPVERTRP
ncbi:hypothetical protein [Streptomyces cinereospinus]|uniref:Uncharacterized protein n=1 Tax=Streptomyces cinereospinus TaxID=285561 RepID=A0ABV5N0D2_9ACTN